MTKHAQILERFAEQFGAPFLLGQRCAVGSPLGKDGLLAIKHGLGIDTRLADACERQLQEAAFLFDVTPAPFDEDAGTILWAVHELFATTHPQASSFYARAHLFCRAAAQEITALPKTLDAPRLLTRHLLIERAFRTTRSDVHLSWWTGSADFYGAEPPRRLTAWPGVRRVRSDRTVSPMWKLAMQSGDEELRVARTALLVSLLDISPLTRLLFLGDPAQKALGFSLLLPYKLGGKKASPLDALEDRALARGVVDALLAVGLDVAGPPLALALLQSLREQAPPRVLRRATELCVHLALMSCVIEAEAPGARESGVLRAFLDDDLQKLAENMRVFWAAVGAGVALDGRGLALPPILELPDRASPLFVRLRDKLLHPRLRAVGEPLARELERRLPHKKPSTQRLSDADEITEPNPP